MQEHGTAVMLCRAEDEMQVI